jgi:thiosulfate/3-mercaptopyruvate sulfurtransferase
METRNNALVSPEWLHERLNDVVVLDASWHMPDLKRSGSIEHCERRIPGAKFFDIDGVSDFRNPSPHMLPSTEAFTRACAALGIAPGGEDARPVVVYDANGMFSSARAWWMFRVFGRDDIFVLDGGFPAWESAGFDVDTNPVDEKDVETHVSECKKAMECENAETRDFKGIRSDLVKTKAEMVENATSTSSAAFRVVDARGNARFRGETVEPRAGVRSGHIPGSRNVFFGDLLDDTKRFKSVAEMDSTFARAGIDLKTPGPIVATCGTGVTACILALAMHECGVKDVGVYDGSWTEYGGADDETCPIATGEPTA